MHSPISSSDGVCLKRLKRPNRFAREIKLRIFKDDKIREYDAEIGRLGLMVQQHMRMYDMTEENGNTWIEWG